jgi:hypothetical protein
MLDNSVAGGISSGMSPWESIIKESMEEASLAEDVVRQHAHSAGPVSYYFRYVPRWNGSGFTVLHHFTVPLPDGCNLRFSE